MLRKCDEVSQKLLVESAFSQCVLSWNRKKLAAAGVFTDEELDWLVQQFAFTSQTKLNIRNIDLWTSLRIQVSLQANVVYKEVLNTSNV